MKRYIAYFLALITVWFGVGVGTTGLLMLPYHVNIKEEFRFFAMWTYYYSPGILLGLIFGLISARNSYSLYKEKERRMAEPSGGAN